MDVETTDHLSYDNEDADVDYAADDADDDDFKPFTPSQSLASSGQSTGVDVKTPTATVLSTTTQPT